MVGQADSPTRTVYVYVTLNWFKVKVKVTGLLNFRQLAKPCMLAAMTAAPLRDFLVITYCFYSLFCFKLCICIRFVMCFLFTYLLCNTRSSAYRFALHVWSDE